METKTIQIRVGEKYTVTASICRPSPKGMLQLKTVWSDDWREPLTKEERSDYEKGIKALINYGRRYL